MDGPNPLDCQMCGAYIPVNHALVPSRYGRGWQKQAGSKRLRCDKCEPIFRRVYFREKQREHRARKRIKEWQALYGDNTESATE